MAILGTEGFGALPKYCAAITGALFFAGAAMCGLRDALPKNWSRFVPSPMAMGIPLYIGAATAIDFWLGSVVMHVVRCCVGFFGAGECFWCGQGSSALFCFVFAPQLLSLSHTHLSLSSHHQTSPKTTQKKQWEAANAAGAEAYGPIVGAGLLVGDGVFSIPSSLLAIFDVAPPICMAFFNGGSELVPS